MDKMTRSGQDLTIAIILSVIVFLGTAYAFHTYFYTAKLSEIESMKTQRTAKEKTFNSYKVVIEEKLNYESQLEALNAAWVNNKHYFVNGLVDWTDKEKVRETQFTIFQLYEKVIEAATFAGVEVDHPAAQPFEIYISENLEFHPDDVPFDFPPHFIFLSDNWEFINTERFPEEGADTSGAADTGTAPAAGAAPGGTGFGTGGSAGTSAAGGGAKQLFNAHDFSVKFEATYDQLKRFVEILQDLEGDEAWVITVHCFETTDDPLIFGFQATIGGDRVYTDVKIPMEMFCTAYELYELGATNDPPNLPGSTSCNPSGGGGGSSSGGGGSSSGGSGGGAGFS
jgi:uncharacterized membrane protein YgcG